MIYQVKVNIKSRADIVKYMLIRGQVKIDVKLYSMPKKIWSLGIDIQFFEDLIKNKVYNCQTLCVMVITNKS